MKNAILKFKLAATTSAFEKKNASCHRKKLKVGGMEGDGQGNGEGKSKKVIVIDYSIAKQLAFVFLGLFFIY